MNPKTIKKDFPAYTDDLVYLDSAASALKPNVVIDKINKYYTDYGVNVNRGVYKLSHESTLMYEESRQTCAKFINALEKEIVFTRGVSSSLNLIALSYGLANVNEGDEIIVSELEHHSSILPWLNVCKQKNAKLVYVPLDETKRITLDNFKSVLTPKTKVVALTHISNVMGYLTPMKEIIAEAHKVGAIVSVDAAQSAPHMKINVKDLDADFLSFTGHKLCGPTGIGVMYGKYDLLQSMDPIEFGGDMIDVVEKFDATWKDAPFKFETGTPLIASAIALKDAIEYIENIGFDNIQSHEKELIDYCMEKISKIDGVSVYNTNPDCAIVAFNIDGVHPHDAASIFDKNNVCLRAGHHCAQLLIKNLKQIATLRASFYIYNSKEDVDKFIDSVIEAKDFFKDMMF